MFVAPPVVSPKRATSYVCLTLLLTVAGACSGHLDGQGPGPQGGEGGDDTNEGGGGAAGRADGGTSGMAGSGGRLAADAAAPQDTAVLPSSDARAEGAPDLGPLPPAPDGGVVSALPPVEPSDVPLPACKRTVNVANSATLATAIGDAKAGDCIVLADGDYVFPMISAKGTATAPIVIRAANLLKATVTTGGLLIKSSSYVVVQGLTWNAGVVDMKDSDHCRFSRSRVHRDDDGGGSWVAISGTSKYCRIDHNDFGPQDKVGNMIQLSGAGEQIVQYNRVDHNFFHDVHFCCSNGWESIRAGLSGFTFSSAHNIIEFNLFLRVANDPEAVSLKSSDNVLRYNTMRASAAQFSLRHGNRTLVYGNYILGDGVAGTQGLRVCGSDHRVFNNYVEGVDSYGIMLEGGESDDKTGALTDHKQVFRAMVLFNTVVNSRAIDVGGGHALKPVDCTVSYNIVQGSGDLIRNVAGTKNTTFIGNIVNGTSSVTTGVMMTDPKLIKMGDVFQIGPGSPAIDAADTKYPFVVEDARGVPRVPKPDIGSTELSAYQPPYGILTEADVGPKAP